MVMYAMNAFYFDHYKHRLFSKLERPTDPQIFNVLDQTLLNLAAMKPTVIESSAITGGNTGTSTGPAVSSLSSTMNPRYRRISLIESLQERERRKRIEPIYGIDHRRQFVKNRQALPPSSHVPSNWRPFKTIRYEREINNSKGNNIGMSSSGITTIINSNTTASTSSNTTVTNTANTANTTNINTTSTSNTSTTSSSTSSLAKLYYCVNVFYAPPPTFPPIQLFLQVGTSPDTSTSGFLHRLQFTNLIETENYLQNLRNLLLIENGNCNLKVITDISTTTTGNANSSSVNSVTPTGTTTTTIAGSSSNPSVIRKPPPPPPQPNMTAQPQSTTPSQSSQSQQYHLTPHQILQLNQQQRNSSKQPQVISPSGPQPQQFNNKF